MFIPIVSRVAYTRIINKTIIYSDTVLKLDELGSTLTLTTINDLKEDDLEKCLKTIFENNPNITFNTIQYSKIRKNYTYMLIKKQIFQIGKIEDCPKWMKTILYETRKQQLEELAKKEEKKETIRRIKRFFNPFSKK